MCQVASQKMYRKNSMVYHRLSVKLSILDMFKVYSSFSDTTKCSPAKLNMTDFNHEKSYCSIFPQYSHNIPIANPLFHLVQSLVIHQRLRSVSTTWLRSWSKPCVKRVKEVMKICFQVRKLPVMNQWIFDVYNVWDSMGLS